MARLAAVPTPASSALLTPVRRAPAALGSRRALLVLLQVPEDATLVLPWDAPSPCADEPTVLSWLS